jgi:UDP-N-acetylmuramyl pentapeptide phosphotransferase/UDP-N-acetylglucosamine-1-phosphate transferase
MIFIVQVLAFTVGFGFLASLLLVRLSVLFAHEYQVLARPSDRGSHQVATPRLGGLGLAIAFMFGLFFIEVLCSRMGNTSPWLYALVVASCWALVGGLLDDILDLPASNKFLFQAAAGGSFVFLGGGLEFLVLPGLGALQLGLWLGGLLTFVLVVFWINAFNFMDGMDGQAALFACLVALGLAIPLQGISFLHPVALLSVLLFGCCYGLYTQNSPGVPQHRKTFMGDGGSHFLGMVMVGLIIAAAQISGRSDRPHQLPLVGSLILLFPFIYDVTFTLLRRLLRGENIFQAHRSHLYQRLMVAGWSHRASLTLGLVTWLACFFFSQLYFWASLQPIPPQGDQWLALSGAVVVMMLYTLVVWLVEMQPQKQDS